MVQAARGSGAKEYAKVWCCVCVCVNLGQVENTNPFVRSFFAVILCRAPSTHLVLQDNSIRLRNL